MFEGFLRGFTTIKKCWTSQKQLERLFDDFVKNKNEFSGRFVDVGLENVAVGNLRAGVPDSRAGG